MGKIKNRPNMGKKLWIKKVAVCVRECRFGGSFCLLRSSSSRTCVVVVHFFSFVVPSTLPDWFEGWSLFILRWGRIGPMKVGIHPVSVMNCWLCPFPCLSLLFWCQIVRSRSIRQCKEQAFYNGKKWKITRHDSDDHSIQWDPIQNSNVQFKNNPNLPQCTCGTEWTFVVWIFIVCHHWFVEFLVYFGWMWVFETMWMWLTKCGKSIIGIRS